MSIPTDPQDRHATEVFGKIFNGCVRPEVDHRDNEISKLVSSWYRALKAHEANMQHDGTKVETPSQTEARLAVLVLTSPAQLAYVRYTAPTDAVEIAEKIKPLLDFS